MADSSVLIEGSLTPAVGYLKRGEQAKVPLTDEVTDLVAKGFLLIREETAAPAPAATPTAPVGEATPVQAPDQTVPAVPNPAVDNSLVDGSAPTATTRTAAKK